MIAFFTCNLLPVIVVAIVAGTVVLDVILPEILLRVSARGALVVLVTLYAFVETGSLLLLDALSLAIFVVAAVTGTFAFSRVVVSV